jgi:hypothetical protein
MTSILPNPVVHVEVTTPAAQTVAVTSATQTNVEVTSGLGYRAALSKEYQLISGRLVDYPVVHKEFSYTGTNLTGISVWNGPAKQILLITIQFAYTGSNLTQKNVSDVVGGITLTVDYVYTGSNLTGLTEALT